MAFKYSVGQAVEYTPIGEKQAGLFRIVRQMPEEGQAVDLRYRIKSAAEIHERNVLECHLNLIDEGRIVEHEIERSHAKMSAVKLKVR